MITQCESRTAPTLLSIALCIASTGPILAQHMNATDAPCRSGGTTVKETNCFYEAASKANVELNGLYTGIQARLAPNERNELQVAQRLWLGFREANCVAERGLYAGGSASSMVYAACLEADARERIRELKTIYDWVPSRHD
jgi:uncharacterized protein YecT (DUF1311 family)